MAVLVLELVAVLTCSPDQAVAFVGKVLEFHEMLILGYSVLFASKHEAGLSEALTRTCAPGALLSGQQFPSARTILPCTLTAGDCPLDSPVARSPVDASVRALLEMLDENVILLMGL